MSDKHDGDFLDTPRPDADHLAPLLRLAGPRETVPAERMLRVKTAVRAEWLQQTRARSRRKSVAWSVGALATAALALLGVRMAVRDDVVPIPRLELATVESLSGAVRLTLFSGPGIEPALFQLGDRIREGDGVDTTSGGMAALRLASGVSLRIDRGTRVRFISGNAMALDQGAIYVDSDDGGAGGALEVRTVLGVVRDIGTRFEVRLEGPALRVRVRDGLIRLSQSREHHDARPGEELTLDGSGSLARRAIPVHGPDWAWAATLARPFALEGRSLRDFLDWIAAENGWQLQFADPAVNEKSKTTTLHGSIEGLTPEESLASVLPVSGVGYRLANGVLVVQPGTGGPKN